MTGYKTTFPSTLGDTVWWQGPCVGQIIIHQRSSESEKFVHQVHRDPSDNHPAPGSSAGRGVGLSLCIGDVGRAAASDWCRGSSGGGSGCCGGRNWLGVLIDFVVAAFSDRNDIQGEAAGLSRGGDRFQDGDGDTRGEGGD